MLYNIAVLEGSTSGMEIRRASLSLCMVGRTSSVVGFVLRWSDVYFVDSRLTKSRSCCDNMSVETMLYAAEVSVS